ncbi:MAG: class I SAM-dependent methyltransferase [Alphaproteobacteria bacterium]|nr:class I SAM-dependent methyltransferase [Alphaproteobacteria bacterium]
MKRVHVFEFEDAPWLPSWLRSAITNLIPVVSRGFGVHEVMAELVARALGPLGLTQVVDLGTGAGGVMPDVLERLRERPELSETTLVLTDLHPNDQAVERFNDPARPHVRYERRSVDATSLAEAPNGLKTMVNCFHHLRPEQARAVLRSAQDSRQPLLIHEMGENRIPFALWALLLPISLPIGVVMTLFITPFVRPLTPRQLAFTYLVPIIPLLFAWDGQASMPRIYDGADVDALLEGLGDEGYRWERGEAPTPRGPKMGIYLLGMPA